MQANASQRILVIGSCVAALLSHVLVGCGGTDEGRIEPDSNKSSLAEPAGCKLAETLELTLAPSGSFESSIASAWKYNNDGSTEEGGADSQCPQDSSLSCADDDEVSADALTSPFFGGNLRTWAYDDQAPAPPECVTGTRGLHVRAEGLYVWGAQLAADYSNTGVKHYDASAFDGVSFWARSANGKMGRSLYFAFEDRYTREDAAPLVDADGKPILDSNGRQAFYCFDSKVDVEKCDRFGTGVGLETEWRFYKVPFAAVTQRGFGVKSERLLTDELLGMSFYMDVGDWDFWIDDVSFYREKE